MTRISVILLSLAITGVAIARRATEGQLPFPALFAVAPLLLFTLGLTTGHMALAWFGLGGFTTAAAMLIFSIGSSPCHWLPSSW